MPSYLVKGRTFATNEQVTAANLNTLVDSATIGADAVDGTTLQVSASVLSVKDGGVTTGKLSTGAPTWDSSGNVTIGGAATITGGQIVFPATQSASTNANTLDDYEEGSWTPTLGGTATYSAQVGRYTKIGRVVHIECRLTVTLIGTGSTSTISGLPFSANSAVAGTVGYFQNLALAPVFITAFTNTSTLVLAGITSANADITTNLAALGDTSDIAISCTYTV